MTDTATEQRLLVVAVGGNAILQEDDDGSIEQQQDRARGILGHVADLVQGDSALILTHGNGPIVGNILLRNEAARDRVTPMPLYIDDADSQGGIGFMLQSLLGNELTSRGVKRPVATVVTQVVVDPADPAFHHPTKPVGPVYDEDAAEALARDEDWYFAEVADGRFRRVVPSPEPTRIVELASIRDLARAGTIVIACGGGGVPVVESEEGVLAGAEAVIDKDLTSALLAIEVGADALLILMEAEAVVLNWGSERAEALAEVPAAELRSHLQSGAFQEGSMAPKVEAALRFVEATGNPATICDAESAIEALAGRAGTRILPDT